MYRQFNVHNSTFCPHTVFMCFVWISQQTAIIYLYNINWLVCITETESVYCAVRTGSLSIVQVSGRLSWIEGLCSGISHCRFWALGVPDFLGGHKITIFLTIYTWYHDTVGEHFCGNRTANSRPLTGGSRRRRGTGRCDCRSWNETTKLEERIYEEKSGSELSDDFGQYSSYCFFFLYITILLPSLSCCSNINKLFWFLLRID